jgi:DNA repair protein RecO (recombination protein O)
VKFLVSGFWFLVFRFWLGPAGFSMLPDIQGHSIFTIQIIIHHSVFTIHHHFMTHKTKGIVLRAVKYGETSLVVTMFTKLYGLQSYMVNGVRTTSAKGSSKAVYFQPGALLDVVIYHNELKNLQRIKEYKWDFLYENLLSDILKNAVMVFMIELLSKCLKEPEPNNELFDFVEDALIHLDKADKNVTANFPIYFAIHLAVFFGFRISDEHSEELPYLDLQEGVFTKEAPAHYFFLEGKEAALTGLFLKAMHPNDLHEIKLSQHSRRIIITGIEQFYALHVAEFGSMKTLPVLREISD